jgi:ssDNA-binding Zn-finger/Zn-ribbon topoisomerase 1
MSYPLETDEHGNATPPEQTPKCPKCGKTFEVVAVASDYHIVGCPEHREYDQIKEHQPECPKTTDNFCSECGEQLTPKTMWSEDTCIKCAEALELEPEKDIKEVNKALRIVENAQNDKDFLKWVEENRDVLEFDYDQYQSGCFGGMEEPDGFYLWCLNRYVAEKLQQKEITLARQ